MYTKIESSFWQDDKMREISDDARYLMLYLLSSPHRNILGFYYLPIPYACFDLQWPEERFRKGFKELLDNGRVAYDFNAHILLVLNYLKHNPLENPNQVKSAISKLDELPDTALLDAFATVLKRLYKPLLEPLCERLRERLGKPVTVTGTETVPVPPPNPPPSEEGGAPADPLSSDPMKPVTQFLVTNLIPTASPYQVDRLAAWVEDDGVEPDLVIWAMEQALLHGQRRLSYVEGILRRCRDQGITTRKAAEYAEAERIEAQARGDPHGDRAELGGTPIPIDMDELDRLQQQAKELMASGIGDK